MGVTTGLEWSMSLCGPHLCLAACLLVARTFPRGLMLREISIRHWPKVVAKEVSVGLMNGLGIAATTAIGVYLWSGSMGLVYIIASAMVIAMVIAGVAGALVPIVLSRFGMDPATASSIVLTTVTDVAARINILAALSSAVAAGVWFLVAHKVISTWIAGRWQRYAGAAAAAGAGDRQLDVRLEPAGSAAVDAGRTK